MKAEKSLNSSIEIYGHHKAEFVLSIDKVAASNFASSAIVFFTFIFSNHVINHINTTDPSKLKEFPNYILVYLYYLAIFNIHTFSVAIWYFIRMPQLKLTILRELKSAFRDHSNNACSMF